MKRWLARIFLFLLLGAIVNVAVAWGSSRLPNTPSSRRAIREAQATNGPAYSGWHVTHTKQWAANRIDSIWTGTLVRVQSMPAAQSEPSIESLIPRWAEQLIPAMEEPSQAQYIASAWEYGLPVRSVGGLVIMRHENKAVRTQLSFSGGRVQANSQSDAPEILVSQHCLTRLDPAFWIDEYAWALDRPLIYEPIWPGFAINTVFYAVVLWLLSAGPFGVRRWRRIRRGRCPKCAYDLRGSVGETCPECGVPVSLSSRGERAG